MKKYLLIFFTLSLFIFLGSKLDIGAAKGVSGCAFCNEQVLKSQVFYKGDLVLGVLTHKPAVSGHVLIIPERHVERFEDLAEEEVKEMRKVIQKLHVALGSKDYLLLQKNGKRAGQSVPHVHFHYLPAEDYLTVRFFVSPWLKPLTEDQMEPMREALSKAM